MSDRERSADRARSAASELRSYALGEIGEIDHKDVSREAGLIEDADLRHTIEFARRAYNKHRDAEDPDFEATEWYQRLVERGAGDMATEAVREGNISQMAHVTGEPGRVNDVSGMHTFMRLESWLLDAEDAKMLYIAGHQGSGKTDFAHLILEVISQRLEERGEEVSLSSNIPTSRDTRTIQHYDRLRDWFTGGESTDNKWFVFDEASSELSGYAHDSEKVEKYLSGLIKRMRKNGCNLIVIGHTGKDVHPDVRRLADFVSKPSKKTARVYRTVNQGEGTGHRFDLDQVPQTTLEYDTEDEAEWYWRGVEDDVSESDPMDTDAFREWRNQKIEALYKQNDFTQKQLAGIFDMSDRQVRRVLS